MIFKDTAISTQLRLGLALILVLVVILGILAWRQTDLLWLQTKTMYDHPVQVRRAIGALQSDILKLRLAIKDLVISDSDLKISTVLKEIESLRDNASKQFKILDSRYLGPRSDVTGLYEDFKQWDVIRDETVRLLQSGNKAEAITRTQSDGQGKIQAEKVVEHLQKIGEFALAKGDELYEVATVQKLSLNRQLTAFIVVILLFSMLVSWYLLRGIKQPLQELTNAAKQFRQGKMDARSDYVSKNEFGTLTTAFNLMAETVQTQLHISEQAAQLAGVMLQETEARSFCRELLKTLIEHTGSQIAAIYLLNQTETEFEHFDSIGLGHDGRASFSALQFDGEFGAALATGQMHRISDIPEDTRFTFTTVSGEFKPKEIITLPLLSNHSVPAILSLASIRNYDSGTIRLLEDILSMVAARMSGILAFRQIQNLAAQLEQQNSELEIQRQKMATQANELSHQNSELEMQKQQMEEANRLKSVFLSNMSHELRTPLNSVISLSRVLSRRLDGVIPGEDYGYLEIIERNGKSLLMLINDILDLSRIEAGREEINLSQFTIHELVDEIVAMLNPQAREKGIVLQNLVDDNLPAIISDADKCLHILQNLINNAVKFIKNGRIEISSWLVDNQLHIAVQDTGIGISTDQLPHIFDEFRQADDTASRKFGGTGLGLSIAKKYATCLQGQIDVKSVLGQGSTFTLRLPVTIPRTSGENGVTTKTETKFPTTTPAPDFTEQGHGQTILLVEDSEPAIIQVTDIVFRHGYRVLVARNGHEALEHIEKTQPEAMILDLMMPEMDGFELLGKIRSTPKAALLPVLILTAKHVTKEELSFLKGNNIHQLIQKGDINRNDLLAAIGRMVARKPKNIDASVRERVHKVTAEPPVILVVEDNQDNMYTIRALLKDSYTIIEAMDGREGVIEARKNLPDIILMDIALPVLDGIAALAEIKQEKELYHIPVVAVTASVMKGDREEILAHGFDDYIPKPIDDDLLNKTIMRLLDGLQ